ncbi:uncharacterized protein N7487_004724 [Penicillium crustosum]|uniref:uncharacterized protein n=1 Tax=Penicillium crustosum TaxID=36656 RepID=UPI00239291FA|nr:uncharacterized protein N7487_004724 [Penicillium crustosum]KAJ5410365.1 hypothetical protein N7487_004724 [Penicillium crustosum]
MSGYERLRHTDDQATNSNVDQADIAEEEQEQKEAGFPLLEEKLEDGQTETQKSSKLASFSVHPSTVLLLSLSAFILSLLFYTIQYYFAATDALCQQRMWAFSPEADFLEYESRQYNSDLVSHDFIGVPTQYRRDAWDNLWKSLINKSTETHEWWSLPPPRDNEVIAMSEGIYEAKFIAVMHQVHCVGVLWLFAHRDEWDFRTIRNMTEDFMKIHSRHCNVMLMNMIKCMADVTPVLFQKDVNNSASGSGLGKWKTIDAPRRCKNFDKLWNWERENSICPMGCVPEDIARLYPESI